MTRLVLILILIGVLSCHQNNDPEPDQTGYACGQVIAYRFRNINATQINYAKEIGEYYIKMYPDTSRFQTVAVFCNLPDPYKEFNRVLNFEGSFSPLNSRDSIGRDGRLRKYFLPAQVMHLAVDKVN